MTLEVKQHQGGIEKKTGSWTSPAAWPGRLLFNKAFTKGSRSKLYMVRHCSLYKNTQKRTETIQKKEALMEQHKKSFNVFTSVHSLKEKKPKKI